MGERDLGLTFALENVGFIDFESRSRTSITAGAYRYATEADAIVLAYAVGDAEPATAAVRTFHDGSLAWDSLPADFRAHHARVVAGEAIWAAWNAGFDKAIWNYSTIGFPLLQTCHIIDVMAQAVNSGLPSDLAGAARASASLRKDASGGDLIKLFCEPAAVGNPQTHPDAWRAFRRYAEGDIESLRSIFLGTRQLPLAEWREYWAMEAINERGIGIDLPMVARAAALAAEDRLRSKGEISRLTDGAVASVDQVARLARWLLARLPAEGCALMTKRIEEVGEDGAVTIPAAYSLTRSRVEHLIALVGAEPPSAKRDTLLRVLQLRLYGGSRTPAKFSKMLAQNVDGVLFGQYVFNGASQTGRASSRGVQIHNLARDALAHEHATIEAVLSGCDYNALLHCNSDPVARQLSLLIRPSLIPCDPDNVFVWSDWSQIEARVLPWLAGAEDAEAQARLDIFREVDADPSLPDLYTRTAAAISGVSLEDVTPAIRQRGKVAELALGFGGSIGALQAMGAGYGLYLTDAEARQIVDRWRAANHWGEVLWERIETAALSALGMPMVEFPVGRLIYVFLPMYLGGSLFCQLPSGRCLIYRDIRFESVEEEDDDGKVTRSVQLRCSRAHGRIKLWKGIFVENVVQATAADILRGTLVRLESEGFVVRATTHDEILVETSPDKASMIARRLRAIMQQGFDWTEGLPLMSEETIAPYYSKHKAAYYTRGEMNHAAAE